MDYNYIYLLSWQLLVAVYLNGIDIAIGHTLRDHLELKTNCVCPGDTVTFAECTTVGGSGFTIWRGTAFDCMSNDIVLSHTFDTTAGECNNGSIVGQGVKVSDNQYTSQINITLSSNLTGKTIQCFHESLGTQNITEVGTLTIPKIGPAFPPPTALFISQGNFVSRQITFNWNEVITDCSVYYSILAMNCGSCPSTTNLTAVTCTDVPTDGTTCKFAVKTVSCGDTENLLGDINLTLNLPFIPPPAMPNSKRDSLSVLIAGIVLLLVTVALVISIYLTWICRKWIISAFKSFPLHQHRTCNSNQSEDMYTMQNATIKIFDNEKMGTYGLDDSITCQNKNPVITINKIDRPDLNSLLHMLKEQAISSKWYQFGLALGVPKNILDQLTDYSEENSLVELLDYWLKHHPHQPTWKEVTDAQNKLCFYESVS